MLKHTTRCRLDQNLMYLSLNKVTPNHLARIVECELGPCVYLVAAEREADRICRSRNPCPTVMTMTNY